jgi:hypothetical protein
LNLKHKIVDKKEILPVRTVSNSGIYFSSDRVGRVYNKCSKIPPSTSMQHVSHRFTSFRQWRSKVGGKDTIERPSQTAIQLNGSISETVRNRSHVHINSLA